ncbi:pentatricopeptide repeat-containing protein At3g51320-like [Mangifera indica]|uniref:pentatricopeptide repeat-containing protein At3g51320-like n=1 Tax=Mangifera indica TaxID=29780 RepID=UPI001CFAA385|nr:pentatricopeptide repeat-containing protein At3g51320-like [Mangifera indica]
MENLQAAHQLCDVMTKRNVTSWNILISGYSKCGNLGCSLKLFKEMVKSGSFEEVILQWLVCLLSVVDIAQRVFDRMEIRNLVCWNAMIFGHCIHGKPEARLKLFTTVVDQTGADGKSISPDEITFISVLCACVRAELLTEGRSYFNPMIDLYKIKSNFAHYWCLANLYSGSGLIKKAEKILRKMPKDEKLPSES